MQQSSYLPPVYAFLSQRLKWVMCFWLRPKVLMVITLLSLALIIPCLRGAITEASTSNSAELKKEGGNPLEALQLIMSREERNEIFTFDCFGGKQIMCVRLKLSQICIYPESESVFKLEMNGMI